MNNKKLVLLILFGLVISMVYAYKYTPHQKRLSCSIADVRQTKRLAKNKSTPFDAPTLSMLKEAPHYPGYHVDLFRPLFDSTPTPNPVLKKPAPPSNGPPLPRLLPPPIPQEAFEPPELPVAKKLAHFIYLGQVCEVGKRAIFLKGNGRIFVVRSGENFGEKQEFRLAQVTDKEIRIAMGKGGDLICIPLEEKKALTASSAWDYPSSPLPNPLGGETL